MSKRQGDREGLEGLLGPDVVLPTSDGDVVEWKGLIVTDGLALRRRIFEQGWLSEADCLQKGRTGHIVGNVDPQFDFSWRTAHETDGHFVHGGVLDHEFGRCDGATEDDRELELPIGWWSAPGIGYGIAPWGEGCEVWL